MISQQQEQINMYELEIRQLKEQVINQFSIEVFIAAQINMYELEIRQLKEQVINQFSIGVFIAAFIDNGN